MRSSSGRGAAAAPPQNKRSAKSVVGARAASELAQAVHDGNMKLLKDAFSHGAHANIQLENDWSPLMVAAHDGHLEIAKELLSRKASVTAVTKHGWTPLIVAALNGQESIAKLIISKKAVVNHADDQGWTALLMAAYSGNETIVSDLIAARADATAVTRSGQTALVVALRRSYDNIASVIQKELDRLASDPSAASDDRHRRAHAASAAHRGPTLVSTGGDGHSPSGGHTSRSAYNAGAVSRQLVLNESLLWAARRGDLDAVRRLYDDGAQISYVGPDGQCAAEIARAAGSRRCRAYLESKQMLATKDISKWTFSDVLLYIEASLPLTCSATHVKSEVALHGRFTGQQLVSPAFHEALQRMKLSQRERASVQAAVATITHGFPSAAQAAEAVRRFLRGYERLSPGRNLSARPEIQSMEAVYEAEIHPLLRAVCAEPGGLPCPMPLFAALFRGKHVLADPSPSARMPQPTFSSAYPPDALNMALPHPDPVHNESVLAVDRHRWWLDLPLQFQGAYAESDPLAVGVLTGSNPDETPESPPPTPVSPGAASPMSPTSSAASGAATPQSMQPQQLLRSSSIGNVHTHAPGASARHLEMEVLLNRARTAPKKHVFRMRLFCDALWSLPLLATARMVSLQPCDCVHTGFTLRLNDYDLLRVGPYLAYVLWCIGQLVMHNGSRLLSFVPPSLEEIDKKHRKKHHSSASDASAGSPAHSPLSSANHGITPPVTGSDFAAGGVPLPPSPKAIGVARKSTAVAASPAPAAATAAAAAKGRERACSVVGPGMESDNVEAEDAAATEKACRAKAALDASAAAAAAATDAADTATASACASPSASAPASSPDLPSSSVPRPPALPGTTPGAIAKPLSVPDATPATSEASGSDSRPAAASPLSSTAPVSGPDDRSPPPSSADNKPLSSPDKPHSSSDKPPSRPLSEASRASSPARPTRTPTRKRPGNPAAVVTSPDAAAGLPMPESFPPPLRAVSQRPLDRSLREMDMVCTGNAHVISEEFHRMRSNEPIVESHLINDKCAAFKHPFSEEIDWEGQAIEALRVLGLLTPGSPVDLRDPKQAIAFFQTFQPSAPWSPLRDPPAHHAHNHHSASSSSSTTTATSASTPTSPARAPSASASASASGSSASASASASGSAAATSPHLSNFFERSREALFVHLTDATAKMGRWRPPKSTAGLTRVRDRVNHASLWACSRHAALAAALDPERFVALAPGMTDSMDPDDAEPTVQTKPKCTIM